jgi:hypothetical protein
MQPDEADDVTVQRFGFPADTGGTIYTGYMLSPTGANNLSFTSSFNASGIAIDRGHKRGSNTRIC